MMLPLAGIPDPNHTDLGCVRRKEGGGLHLAINPLASHLGKPFVGDLKSSSYWSLGSADELADCSFYFYDDIIWAQINKDLTNY